MSSATRLRSGEQFLLVSRAAAQFPSEAHTLSTVRRTTVLNSLDFTELCLGSLFSNTTPGYSSFETVGGDLEIVCFWGALSTTETMCYLKTPTPIGLAHLPAATHAALARYVGTSSNAHRRRDGGRAGTRRLLEGRSVAAMSLGVLICISSAS